jgi:hypothetical protein
LIWATSSGFAAKKNLDKSFNIFFFPGWVRLKTGYLFPFFPTSNLVVDQPFSNTAKY